MSGYVKAATILRHGFIREFSCFTPHFPAGVSVDHKGRPLSSPDVARLPRYSAAAYNQFTILKPSAALLPSVRRCGSVRVRRCLHISNGEGGGGGGGEGHRANVYGQHGTRHLISSAVDRRRAEGH